MLVSGGMIKVATVVFGSGSSCSSGRRSFHTGSIFILSVLASCLRKPCSERNLENSASLSVGIPNWSDSSFKLCHVPSLRAVKNFSRYKLTCVL